MSVAESHAQQRTLSGWGRTAPSRASVLRPADASEVQEILAAASELPGGLIARGAGRSYGDPAQNANGVALDMTSVRWIGHLDPEGPTVQTGAGTTLGALINHLAPRGFTLPVVPGTKHVTVGGAIAADVHGKNHLRDGSFGFHVRALTLCTPGGSIVELSRDARPELFFATLGGMGLTGVVLAATLGIEPLVAVEIRADIDRTADLDGALELIGADQPSHRYALAWIDLLDTGGARADRRLGRSVVVRSDYATGSAEGGAPSAPVRPLARRTRVSVPRGVPQGLVNPLVVRAFNEFRWRNAPRRARGRPMGWAEHFFPLDALGDWSRLYGPAGLVQYQFMVPLGQQNALREVVELLRRARVPMYLAVLKRLGPGSGGMLSFPIPGLTLAIDVPAGESGLAQALDCADEVVVAAGGRVYLAKDSRMRPGTMAAMYPLLGAFRAVREHVDPGGVLRSDMARRLGLLGPWRPAAS